MIKAHCAKLHPSTIDAVQLSLTSLERNEFLTELQNALPRCADDSPHSVAQWNELTGLQLADTPASQAKITQYVHNLWNELAQPPPFPGMHWS